MFFYLKFFLKCPSLLGFSFPYYNIPRKIRELQRLHYNDDDFKIITYQEKSGNYNDGKHDVDLAVIITYQEKSGNYNLFFILQVVTNIITYQEKSGNYNNEYSRKFIDLIITYQEKSGNYNQ